MRFVAQPISELRLQRFHRWALLWLTWFAGFLEAASAFAPLARQAEEIGHLWLDRIERVLLAIVVLRARPNVRALQPRRAGVQHRLSRSALARAVIGAKLRRALRARGLRRRCEILRRLNLNLVVARLLKRLPRGLTRRRPILTRPERTVIDLFHAASAPTLAFDSS